MLSVRRRGVAGDLTNGPLYRRQVHGKRPAAGGREEHLLEVPLG